MSMRANIATARRNWRPQPKLPHPRADEARQPNGSVCPTCLRFGREECKQHRATPDSHA